MTPARGFILQASHRVISRPADVKLAPRVLSFDIETEPETSEKPQEQIYFFRKRSARSHGIGIDAEDLDLAIRIRIFRIQMTGLSGFLA